MIDPLDFRSGPIARREFLRQLPQEAWTLEIGPANRPVFSGAHVRYFDVLDAAGLHARAALHAEDALRTPERIHYVSPVGDLSIVTESFDLAFSSHAIEHQVDLVRHLQSVAAILRPGGRYAVICPDCRYCFDAHIPPSTIGDVIEAYEMKRTRPRLAAVVNQDVMRSHNDSLRHWDGDTPQLAPFAPDNVRGMMAAWRAAEEAGRYIDVHNFQFTPETFAAIVECLHAMELTALAPERVFATPHGGNEFCALLKLP